jgi:succinate-acetate transporter protein
MSLTIPANFPSSGTKEKKHIKEFIPRQTVQLKNSIQRVIEKNLWIEFLLLVMIIMTGIIEITTRRIPLGWYIVLIIMQIAFLLKNLANYYGRENNQ